MGKIQPAAAGPCQPDCRRRSRRAAGRASSRSWSRTPSTPVRMRVDDHRRGRRQAADSRRRTTARAWSRDDARLAVRAPRHEQDPSRGRPRARSRRSASAARRCRASRRCRTSRCARGRDGAGRGHRDPDRGRRHGAASRDRRAPVGTVRRGARSLLQPAGAPEVPASRRRRGRRRCREWSPSWRCAIADVGVTLANAGRKTVQCPPVASLRDRLYPDLRRARTTCSTVRRRRAATSAHGFVAFALAAEGAGARPQNVFVEPAASCKDRTHRARDPRRLQQASIKERSPEVHLFIEMPLDARGRERPSRPRPRCGSASSRSSIRSCGARLPDALGRRRRRAWAAAWHHLSASDPMSGTAMPTPYAGDVLRSGSWVRARCGSRSRRLRVAGARRGRVAGSVAEQRADAQSRRVSRRRREGDGVETAPVSGETLMPLGQFRDTFIIAVDDEGIAIIDQHVAHERILFERITERLTAGRLEAQRLLDFRARGASRPSATPGARWHAAELETPGVRDRGLWRITSCGSRRCRRSCAREECRAAPCGRSPRISTGSTRGARVQAARQAHRGHDSLSRGREGELSADAREDGAHPRRNWRRDGLLDHLSARAARDAAPDAPRDREELRAVDSVVGAACRRPDSLEANLGFAWRIEMRKVIVVTLLMAGIGVALHGQARAALPAGDSRRRRSSSVSRSVSRRRWTRAPVSGPKAA